MLLFPFALEIFPDEREDQMRICVSSVGGLLS